MSSRQDKTRLEGRKRRQTHAALHYNTTDQPSLGGGVSGGQRAGEQGAGPIVGQDNKEWKARRLKDEEEKEGGER